MTKQKLKNVSLIFLIREEYDILEQHLDSLTSQLLDDYELICLDYTKSKQNKKTLSFYSSKYDFIKIYDCSKLSVGEGLNLSLKISSAPYIIFFDAAYSLINTTASQEMLESLTKNEVDLSQITLYQKDSQKEEISGRYLLTDENKKKIEPSIFNKIFRKAKIDLHNLVFVPVSDIKTCSDLFVLQYLIYSKHVFFISKENNHGLDLSPDKVHTYETETQDRKAEWSTLFSLLKNIFLFHNLLLKSGKFSEHYSFWFSLFWDRLILCWKKTPDDYVEFFFKTIQQKTEIISFQNLSDVQESLIETIKLNNVYSFRLILDWYLDQNKLSQRDKFYIQSDLFPAFNKNNVCVAFSCNNNWVSFFSVLLLSILKHISPNNNYDFIVMTKDISDKNKAILQRILAPYKNTSIRFYDMSLYNKIYAIDSFYSRQGLLPPETYYRLFLPEILKAYEKAIYLDVDMLVNTDIANLFYTDISDYICAAVKDCVLTKVTSERELFWKGLYQYSQNVLNIDFKNYFNAGVEVLNLKKLRKKQYFERTIEAAKIYKPFFLDQDIHNSVFKGHVKFLNSDWNLAISTQNIVQKLIPYIEFDRIKIIHFAGGPKPWDEDNCLYADVWWSYAKMSPFYEAMLIRLIRKKERQISKNDSSTPEKKVLLSEQVSEISKENQSKNLFKENKPIDKYKLLKDYIKEAVLYIITYGSKKKLHRAKLDMIEKILNQ